MHIDFLKLMQLHDSAFPIGSYTQSFGMETYIQADWITNGDELLAFCESYLFENVVYGDAIIVQEIMNGTEETLAHAGAVAHAVKIARETKEASLRMGSQFLQTVESIEGEAAADELKRMMKAHQLKRHYSVVYALYMLQTNIKTKEAVTGFLYSTTTSLVHNAVRAVPLGQKSGMRTISALLPSVIRSAAIVEGLSLADVRNQAVGIELASMEHEHIKVRLFSS